MSRISGNSTVLKSDGGERVPLLAVGGVVVRDRSVLLIRRAFPPRLGVWTFPGGKVRWGERLQDALRRELQEELGLTCRVGPLLGVFELFEQDFHYVILDYLVFPERGSLSPSSEIAACRWVRWEEVPGLKGLGEGVQEMLNRAREHLQL